MKKQNFIQALLLLLLFSSCEKDRLLNQVGIDFTATLEQPNSGESKVRLVNEQWIYWELGDSISIGSNMSSKSDVPPDTARLGGYLDLEDFDRFNGTFHTTLKEGSIYFLALHPFSSHNRIIPKAEDNNKFNTAKIFLKPKQSYRNDSTFDKQVLPMVAWYGGSWDYTVPNLDFHNLAGILRLQFYNATGQNYNISSITVTSSKQLCGMFDVVNRYSFNPHLNPRDEAAQGENIHQLTLTMPEGGLEFASNAIKSFYLVLPALHGMDTASLYDLSITVNATNGSNNYSFTKNMPEVGIRRNGITYSRAIGVTEFSASSTTTVGLVGNGTADRPFKIYSAAELQIIRDSFAHPRNGKVYLNGQEVTADTWFRIMRSDISLSTSNWTSGIQNFKGHMTYYSNAFVSLHGITNRSNQPLFQSISADGIVEGLTMKCDNNITASGRNYSPLCNTNYGTILDCHTTTPSGKSFEFTGTGFAGICVTNDGGTIQGSTCSVIGSFSDNFAGICLSNTNNPSHTSTITGCVASSPMLISGATRAAGICYENSGQVEDCYFDAHYLTGSTDWGGIVYQNNASGKIQHCYMSLSAIIHSDVVGGIVCTNNGTVDYCWSHGELRGTHVGAIASTVSGGKVINCFVDDELCVITLLASGSAHYAGGIAAELTGGSIENSFVYLNHIAHNDNTGVYGSLVGSITGGSITNCYSRDAVSVNPRFYGNKTSGTLTRCWMVHTSAQPDLTGAYTTGQLGDLLSSLNNASLPTGSRAWDSGPKLSPYTLGH